MRRKTHNKYSQKGKKVFNFLQSGVFGIKALSYGVITTEKWEFIDRALQRKFKLLIGLKKNKTWGLIELNNSLTRLSLESRMGKGKGSIYTRSKFIKPGMLLFEFSNLPESYRDEIFEFIEKKIALKLKIVEF
uniref:Ribosomal protein L16 n=1 Tax=Pterocladia lucida TaxID=31408 RepID=A0A6M3WWH5_PTELU|nr:ribosomal protein L16 [Pterocladia lucida]